MEGGRAFLLALLLLSPATAADDSGEVLVSAAISLRDVLGQAWEPLEAGGMRIVMNTAGSGLLLRQILQGAPVDLFLSASPGELDALEREGLLVPGTRCTIASNSLVLVLPPGAPVPNRIEALAETVSGPVAIANPNTVPAGRYAYAALRSTGILDGLESANRLVLAAHVRQVVEYVARGDAGAGLVYATDARRYRGRLTLGPQAPAGSHPPVRYQAALVAGGPNPDDAMLLLQRLQSPEARDVFRQHGFRDSP